MTDDLVVSVFGANEGSEGDPAYETARAVGRKLAELGYVVANGGYGGTMEASARGAKEAGGRTIGVVCSIWSLTANEYVDHSVVTESLPERVQTLIEMAGGGCVVLPGATGTLVELATVWEMMSKGRLPGRPLVCIGSFWQPLIDMMRSVRPASGKFVAVAETPEQLREFFPARKPA